MTFAKLVAATSVFAVVLGVLEVSPAHASVTINVQHCSTSKNTCLDQTVDNNGETCIVVRKDSNHHANWCIYSHGWSHFFDVYVDGRVETCVGYQACVGVDHFHWANNQIVLWQYYGGKYYVLESGSSDIPSAGNTGPTDTLYTTNDYNYSGLIDCPNNTGGIDVHTEADLKVFWKDGTNTSVIIKNSDNYCHNQ